MIDRTYRSLARWTCSFALLTGLSIALLTTPFLATPGLSADADNGKRLAQRWCASCHLIAPDQRASTEAPPFATIAKQPNFDAAKVALFLLEPHPKMPDLGLTRTSAADLAAYIGSQK